MLRAGEALLRPLCVGISAIDLAICRGGTPFVGTLGHEFVATVEDVFLPPDAPEALSQKAAKLKGRRVVGAMNISCGECDLCKSGLGTHCRHRTVLGVAGHDGCFSDRFTLPVHNLCAVPDSVDDERATFAAPLAAAISAANMIRAEGKCYITVLGDGTLGMLTAQVMARQNSSVRLLGKHPERFGLCDRWGIKHRHISEVGRLQDQDVVVDCTGVPEGLALAMQLVRPRGTIILKAMISPQPTVAGAPSAAPTDLRWSGSVNLAAIVANEIQLLGSRCGPVAAAVSLLEKNLVNVEPLISERAKLHDGLAALKRAASGAIKVLMTI